MALNNENKLNKTFTQKDIDESMHKGWKLCEEQYILIVRELRNKIKELEKELKKEKSREEYNGKI